MSLRPEDRDTYVFSYRAVQDAPTTSGVYIIHSAQRWLYVGESADIRQSLFGHLNHPDDRMAASGPLSFSFETTPPEERLRRQETLIAQLQPTWNLAKAV